MEKLTYHNFDEIITTELFTNEDSNEYDIYSGLLEAKQSFTLGEINSINEVSEKFNSSLEVLQDWLNKNFTSNTEPENTQLTEVNLPTQDIYKDVILEVVKPEKVVLFEPKNTRYAPLIPFIMKYAEFKKEAIEKPYRMKLVRDAEKLGIDISWSTIRSLILETRIFEQAKTKQNEDNLLN